MKVIFKYLWLHASLSAKLLLLLCFLILLIGKLIAAYMPVLFKSSIDTLQQMNLIPFLILALYGISKGISNVFIEIQEIIFTPIKQKSVRLLAMEAFKHLYNLNLDFHYEKRAGAVCSLIQQGSRALERFLQFSTFNIFPIFIETLIILLTVSYIYDYFLTLFIASSVILYFLLTIMLTRWRTPYSDQVNIEDMNCNASLIESLLTYETTKYFGNEIYATKAHEQAQKKYEKAVNKSKYSIATLSISQGILVSFSIIIPLIYCAKKLVAGVYTIGDFVLINSYLFQIFLPLTSFSFTYRGLVESLSQVNNLLYFLRPINIVRRNSFLPALQVKEGEIIFQNVSFKYQNNRPILKNISFQIAPKTSVGIVGLSGSGKTTLVRLLTCLQECLSGEIYIDGQNIQALNPNSVRKAIAVVSQDVVLFNKTIFYNIHYGNFEASPEEVKRAAQEAQLAPLIKKLPKGYNSLVGEQGVKLSGGEKQRIAIARALLKKSPIIIFDEATSALDAYAEQEIMKIFKRASYNKTTLIITHRLTTAASCDKILVLHNGSIVEAGSHKDLLARSIHYKGLWDRQNSFFKL